MQNKPIYSVRVVGIDINSWVLNSGVGTYHDNLCYDWTFSSDDINKAYKLSAQMSIDCPKYLYTVEER
jgi:hypothetical protein